jgi:hypothetical protein
VLVVSCEQQPATDIAVRLSEREPAVHVRDRERNAGGREHDGRVERDRVVVLVRTADDARAADRPIESIHDDARDGGEGRRCGGRALRLGRSGEAVRVLFRSESLRHGGDPGAGERKPRLALLVVRAHDQDGRHANHQDGGRNDSLELRSHQRSSGKCRPGSGASDQRSQRDCPLRASAVLAVESRA